MTPKSHMTSQLVPHWPHRVENSFRVSLPRINRLLFQSHYSCVCGCPKKRTLLEIVSRSYGSSCYFEESNVPLWSLSFARHCVYESLWWHLCHPITITYRISHNNLRHPSLLQPLELPDDGKDWLWAGWEMAGKILACLYVCIYACVTVLWELWDINFQTELSFSFSGITEWAEIIIVHVCRCSAKESWMYFKSKMNYKIPTQSLTSPSKEH